MTYPTDKDFYEYKIEKVDGNKEAGWTAGTDDGTGFFIPSESPIEPKAGMTVRFYGKGFGYRFRGMFLDGAKVFYRTEAEDDEHDEIQRYGADAADWLARWDAGKGVWSIEMGGLGPGYEQCIQIVAAEVLRHLIANKVDCTTQYEGDAWKALSSEIDKSLWANEAINALGLSGAQAGAAKSLATKLYKDGPRGVMNTPEIKDRHIQVSKNFPSLAA